MINQSVVLTKISGVITDISHLVTDVNHVGKSITLTNTDAIYIGTPLPFNNLYIRFLGAAINNNPSVLSVSFWDATTFKDFYKVVDGTDTSGATFSKSGILNLIAIDDKLPCSYSTKYMSELGNIDGYYDLYWTRLKVSATLDAVTISYVGQLFVENDTALTMEYPDLASTAYKTAYAAGKTDWLDQRIIATDRVISELITKGHVKSPEQFLDWRLMKEPTMHKTAELIYKGLGPKLRDDMNAANKSFVHSLEARKFGVSHDGNIIKTQKTYNPESIGFYR